MSGLTKLSKGCLVELYYSQNIWGGTKYLILWTDKTPEDIRLEVQTQGYWDSAGEPRIIYPTKFVQIPFGTQALFLRIIKRPEGLHGGEGRWSEIVLLGSPIVYYAPVRFLRRI